MAAGEPFAGLFIDSQFNHRRRLNLVQAVVPFAPYRGRRSKDAEGGGACRESHSMMPAGDENHYGVQPNRGTKTVWCASELAHDVVSEYKFSSYR